jgi:hypothetical protein
MNLPFTGGCACGAIRYQCTAEPVRMGQCHCRDCQRSSGGPFVAVVVVPVDALKVLKGSPRYFDTLSDRGGCIHRGFCPDCGSPVLAKFDLAPHLIGIRAGSLDDPGWFRPDYDIWTSDAQPWDYMNPALPKFEKYPPFARPAKSS